MPRTFLLSLPMPGPIDRGAGLCAAFFLPWRKPQRGGGGGGGWPPPPPPGPPRTGPVFRSEGRGRAPKNAAAPGEPPNDAAGGGGVWRPRGGPGGRPSACQTKSPGRRLCLPRAFQGASRPAAAPLRWIFRRRQGRMKFPGLSSIQLRSARTIPPGKAAAHTLRAAAEQSPCRGLLRGGAFTPSCANLAVGAAQKRDRKTGLFRLLLVGD